MTLKLTKFIYYVAMTIGVLIMICDGNKSHFFDECPSAVFVGLSSLFYFVIKSLITLCSGLINGWGDAEDDPYSYSTSYNHSTTPSSTRHAASSTYYPRNTTYCQNENNIDKIAKTMKLQSNISIKEETDGTKISE